MLRVMEAPSSKPVERPFTVVLHSRDLLAGRAMLLRSKSKLHFLKSRAEAAINLLLR